MNTAQEFRDYMQPFVNSDLKPTAKDLDIQVYSRDRLTVTIGYRSMIPSIMFVADDKKSGFLVYIATVNDTNGPNQHRVVFTWKWADSLDILLKNCTACNNIQLIVESLRGLTAEESTKGMYCPNYGKECTPSSSGTSSVVAAKVSKTKVKSKATVVVAAIALFVCAAVYLGWNYGKGDSTSTGETLGQTTMVGGNAQDQTDSSDSSTSDYFATARLNRQQARDSALSLLQAAAAREDADDTLKEQLNDNIQTMADYTVTETQIENLIIAKGYADCVAFIGEDTLSVAVAAPEGGLTEADIAKIVDVARQVGGFSADQISIIEVE